MIFLIVVPCDIDAVVGMLEEVEPPLLRGAAAAAYERGGTGRAVGQSRLRSLDPGGWGTSLPAEWRTEKKRYFA